MDEYFCLLSNSCLIAV